MSKEPMSVDETLAANKSYKALLKAKGRALKLSKLTQNNVDTMQAVIEGLTTDKDAAMESLARRSKQAAERSREIVKWQDSYNDMDRKRESAMARLRQSDDEKLRLAKAFIAMGASLVVAGIVIAYLLAF